ncbi:hypothetical protein AMTR_s00095p00137240 [Amborella trichopoda]|uniref:Uncharacterized protein n=1 Tax=Amborella trichopoda TaxID=13333 RepID=W1NRM8_AMBTC|nr:hypothetical protein AMTR_s00095p00137240 [Amborella trichopoda]
MVACCPIGHPFDGLDLRCELAVDSVSKSRTLTLGSKYISLLRQTITQKDTGTSTLLVGKAKSWVPT